MNSSLKDPSVFACVSVKQIQPGIPTKRSINLVEISETTLDGMLKEQLKTSEIEMAKEDSLISLRSELLFQCMLIKE